MLQIDKVQQIEGVTVYQDKDVFSTYYLLPQQPRYRLNSDGTPAFRMMKYKFPVDRPDGKLGGGFLMFDAEFVVPEDKMPAILDTLTAQVQAEAARRGVNPVPEVRIGTVTYTKGTTTLIVPGTDGTFVEKLHNPGKPSLYGNNVTTFALELSPTGATFFEQAMQGAGGSVAVVYDLWFWAALPEVKVTAGFNASNFYSFYQTIDTDWNLWSEDEYRETVREQMISSESTYFEPDWGGLTDEKIRTQIRDWAMRTLEEGIERRMIAAAVPVPDDQRTLPDGIEDVTRDISKFQISSFSLVYKEQMAVEWNAVPQGQLQNITQLKDRSGKALQWKDYFTEIDLDDPFFRRLLVNVQANADFDNLPIHSVEVKLLYDGRPMPNLTEGEPEGETVLNHADDLGKFATFVEGDNWEYEYSYEINYRGAAQTYQSPPLKTNEGNLTIGVDDVGILAVDVTAGDLNWNDVSRALVTFRYEDPGHVELIEDQFELTAESPTHEIQHIIFEPMRKNYTYRVKYFLKNGKEVGGKVDVEGRADRLFINDMFVGQKVIGVRGVGDFATRIQTIFLDLEYLDRENEYRQTKSQALNRDVPFFDWSFPILSDAGVVSYKGTVSYTDGTSEAIPSRVAATDTIIVPDAVVDFLEVMVVPDLIDWGTVRLARVSLAYTDPPNNVAERKDFIFSAANHATQTWKVAVKDLQKMTYSHSAVFFMADGTQRNQGPTETAELTLILDPLQ